MGLMILSCGLSLSIKRLIFIRNIAQSLTRTYIGELSDKVIRRHPLILIM